MEAIIQKATELGVSRIVPLLSERVVAHLDDEDAAHKAAKWRLVAMEAIKQCGSAWLPAVEPPLTPDQFLARNESFELPLIASLESGSRPAREYFRAFHAKHGRMPAVGLCLDRPRRRFHPGRNGGDQGSRRPAHHPWPAGPARRNRSHLLPFHSQLRVAVAAAALEP